MEFLISLFKALSAIPGIMDGIEKGINALRRALVSYKREQRKKDIENGVKKAKDTKDQRELEKYLGRK